MPLLLRVRDAVVHSVHGDWAYIRTLTIGLQAGSHWAWDGRGVCTGGSFRPGPASALCSHFIDVTISLRPQAVFFKFAKYGWISASCPSTYQQLRRAFGKAINSHANLFYLGEARTHVHRMLKIAI